MSFDSNDTTENRRLLAKISGVSKRYHTQPALIDVSLEAYKGEIVALVGESGSGKTTLLRAIAGFEKIDSGSIWLDGELVSDRHHHLAPEKRRVSMSFQDHLLFPHLTVLENVRFGMRTKDRKDERYDVMELMCAICMEGFEDRYPHELSGGQVQRVCLARALATGSSMILLDEPFNNLDERLCSTLMDDLRALILNSGTTVIFTTHRNTEVFSISDRIAFMHRGRMSQVGHSQSIYTSPEDSYVASFFGPINAIPARRISDGYVTPLGEIHFTQMGMQEREEPNGMTPHMIGDELMLLIRPHNVELFFQLGSPCRWRFLSRFVGLVRRVRYFGSVLAVEVEVKLAEGNRIMMNASQQRIEWEWVQKAEHNGEGKDIPNHERENTNEYQESIIIRVDVDPHTFVKPHQKVEIGIPHHSITVVDK